MITRLQKYYFVKIKVNNLDEIKNEVGEYAAAADGDEEDWYLESGGTERRGHKPCCGQHKDPYFHFIHHIKKAASEAAAGNGGGRRRRRKSRKKRKSKRKSRRKSKRKSKRKRKTKKRRKRR